jgi:hypothetical protein
LLHRQAVPTGEFGTNEKVPTGEFGTNEKLASALIGIFQTDFNVDRQGATQLFFSGPRNVNDAYSISLSPPSPFEPSPPNLIVVREDLGDERKARLPVDAGVLADDGSLRVAPAAPKLKSGANVRYSAPLGNDTVQLLERVWDAALLRAHKNYRTAPLFLLLHTHTVCIRDDLPGHSDVIACSSGLWKGRSAVFVYELAELLVRYAEAPPAQRQLLKSEIWKSAERALSFLESSSAPPLEQGP